MTQDSFHSLTTALAEGGATAVLDRLVDELRAGEKHHELFDALLMRGRLRLGLPILSGASANDTLSEEQRKALDEMTLAACREVGGLLAIAGRPREAWMYLRPTGDSATVAAALAQMKPNDENLSELIEVALYEGVAPALGYQWVLDHYGTCNAISTYEGAVSGRPKADQQAAAALLLRRVHDEVLGNVQADVERREGKAPAETSLAAIVATRGELLSGHNYHIDTSHLASTVRFARVLEAPEQVRLAIDLAEYGRRLADDLAPVDEEPFVEFYLAHSLLFRAELGEGLDEAIDYFRARAIGTDVAEQGTMAAEVYITLLAKAKRWTEAIDAAATLIPSGARTLGIAPTLMELSERAGDYERLIAICRERGNLVGFAAGLAKRGG